MKYVSFGKCLGAGYISTSKQNELTSLTNNKAKYLFCYASNSPPPIKSKSKLVQFNDICVKLNLHKHI